MSIGKLAVGQADYYLEQAHGSVTRAGAVASGVEDYYLSGSEPAGVWVGDGVPALWARWACGCPAAGSGAEWECCGER